MSSRMPRCGVLALVLVAAFLPARSASDTSVPSPAHSTVPACVVACPSGDIPFEVVVRDFSGLPIGNSLVVLDLSSADGAILCAADDGYAYVAPSVARKLTSNSSPSDWGHALFRLHAAGASTGSIKVYADGVLLAAPRFTSVDQDGDLAVTAADADLLAAKIGSGDLSGDLDCDGAVTSADADLLEAHRGHLGSLNTAVPPGASGDARFRAWPLPAHGAVTFAIPPAGGGAKLEVFDLAGARCWSASVGALAWTMTWDARGRDGDHVRPGVYFARLRSDDREIAGTTIIVSK